MTGPHCATAWPPSTDRKRVSRKSSILLPIVFHVLVSFEEVRCRVRNITNTINLDAFIAPETRGYIRVKATTQTPRRQLPIHKIDTICLPVVSSILFTLEKICLAFVGALTIECGVDSTGEGENSFPIPLREQPPLTYMVAASSIVDIGLSATVSFWAMENSFSCSFLF